MTEPNHESSCLRISTEVHPAVPQCPPAAGSNGGLTRLRLSLAAVAAILILAGCSSGDDTDSVGIEPIESILASDIEFTFDPSGTSANLAVDTSINVACAVIYGTDDTYGSLAVDSDMQGGAHDDHGPLLTNLQPDTEYQYILQGSDTAGTIYRSEPLTFRTPSAIDSGLGTNVALTGTISSVSSEFSDSFGASNAIDGDVGTEWSSAGDGDDAWIEIDLGEPREITAVSFRTRQMTDGTAITDSFTITLDGQLLGPFDNGPDAVMLDQPVTARLVRVDADRTTGGNTGAIEVEIYAAN